MDILKAENITFGYKKNVNIIEDINFQMDNNSIVGLFGDSGSGKTTFGKIITNFIDNYTGSVTVNGEEISSKEFNPVQLIYQHPEKVMNPRWNMGKILTESWNPPQDVLDEFGIKKEWLKRYPSELSGGELQRIAIAAAVLKDADFYYIDEPTSWLDVKQRLNTIEVIRDLTEEKRSVLVIEHDLATVDAMSDYVHVMYGQEGGYGVVSNLKGVRVGINAYVKGFLAEENIRIRDQPIKFEIRPPNQLVESEIITEYTDFSKEFKNFNLEVEGGEIPESQVITAFGPNGIGKTTYAKLLAGIEKPDNGEIKEKIDIGYKPQYIQTDFDGTVEDFLYMNAKGYTTNLFRTDILKPFDLDKILDKQVSKLSGGELQRLATAVTLSEDADVYLLDEPTAFLDVEQRLKVAKAIKHIVTRDDKAAIIIDHDIVFIDYVSDRAMVFYGQSGVEGKATAPIHLRDAMNKFLSDVKITFRRDKETNRPRVNKYDSFLDREQKQKGEYYYLEEEQ